MGQKTTRPLSPHLQVYRWSPQMAISIFHRATGFVLATAGMLTLLWWLSAIGGGAESYAVFQKYVLRHLVLDMGAGYELKTNRTWALAAFVAAIFATALVALVVASRVIGV